MKRLLAAAALAAALSCSAAGMQDLQKHGEEYFRIFSILPDGQGILARRCTKLTQSGLCVGAPVLLPADAVKSPAEEKIVRLADPKENGWHTLQHDNGQKKTVMKMTAAKSPTNKPSQTDVHSQGLRACVRPFFSSSCPKCKNAPKHEEQFRGAFQKANGLPNHQQTVAFPTMKLQRTSPKLPYASLTKAFVLAQAPGDQPGCTGQTLAPLFLVRGT